MVHTSNIGAPERGPDFVPSRQQQQLDRLCSESAVPLVKNRPELQKMLSPAESWSMTGVPPARRSLAPEDFARVSVSIHSAQVSEPSQPGFSDEGVDGGLVTTAETDICVS